MIGRELTGGEMIGRGLTGTEMTGREITGQQGPRTVAAVVLAAGSSTRLGEPKQNVYLGAETLLERTVRIAHRSGLEPVFVVAAPGHSSEIQPPAMIIINDQAGEGMASSIRAGVAAAMAAAAHAVIVLACDQPSVDEEHLRQLARIGDESAGIVASGYAERKGIPAYFSADMFEALMELRGDTGARELLRDARSIPLNKGELDIDTADDLKRARELYASVPPL